MKGLRESLFDDNLVEKDLFEDYLERLDNKKYEPEDILGAQKDLYDFLKKTGAKRYGFFSRGAKRKEFEKALKGGDYIMITFDEPESYFICWVRKGSPNILDQFYIGWTGHWFRDYIKFNWDLNTSETGVSDLIDRLRNHADECILVTNKKQMNDLKECIIKLWKRK